MLKMCHLSRKKFTICVIFFVTIFSFVKNQNQSSNSNRLLTKFRHDTPDPQFHHINYIWTISRTHFNSDNCINSTVFSAATNNKFQWYLLFMPRTMIEKNYFGVYAYLIFDDDNQKVLVNHSIAILNREHEIVANICDPNLHKMEKNNGWGEAFLKKDEYFFDNKLTISYNLSFCEGIVTTDNTSQLPSTIPKPNHNLTDNFASLYKTREYPDVVLIGNETQHPAHKAVLSHRSSVFADMFKRSMLRGKKMKRVHITDLDDEVIEEMLRYIYTGKCENLTNLSNGLLLAAQKYNLTGLKTICVDELSEKLSVENAVNTLLWADQNGVDELKSNAIRFIASKYKEVSETSDWKITMEKRPRFVHQVCLLLSDGGSGGQKMKGKYCS